MPKGLESKGLTEKIRELSLKEKVALGIRTAVRAFALTLALTACNGDNNNNPDSGTDTEDDPCLASADVLPSADGRICFCPGDGDQLLEVDESTASSDILKGLTVDIKEGTFNKCVIVTARKANFPNSVFDEVDGVVVDADNLDHKVLGTDGVALNAIDASNPYNDLGELNEVPFEEDVDITFPDKFGTVEKWNEDNLEFETVLPTTINPTGVTGAVYKTPHFSQYVVVNKPFGNFTINFTAGEDNGYDVNEEGVLLNINLEDEQQGEFPSWVTFSVSDGTNSYNLVPTGTTGEYRLPITEGTHELTFTAVDNNEEEAYRHTAEEDKELDLDEDLCAGVDYDDDDACNGLETCDPSDGSMIPGEDVVCEDSNDCTTDTCEPSDGSCDYDPLPNVGDTCDDSDAYTVDDECQTDGSCVGETVDCINDTDCTDTDLCNGDETCNLSTHTCENGTPIDYDDGDACNGVETCDPTDGSMIPGTPMDCDDLNVCTTDTCSASTCNNDPLPNVGDTCDDGDPDTNNDVCQSDGSCEGYSFEDSCTDNSGVIDGSACWVLANPLENCDTACDVLDSVVNSIDGSCASGEWDDDDGSKCNALTGGAMGYTANGGFAPAYVEFLDRCYQRSDGFTYTLPETICNAMPNTDYERICKCEE